LRNVAFSNHYFVQQGFDDRPGGNAHLYWPWRGMGCIIRE